MATDAYRVGRTTADSVIRASSQLVTAELELAKDTAARVAIYKRQIEVLDGFMKIAQERYKVGATTMADVLAVRAAQLDAEIQLIRQQAGKQPESQQ